MKVLKGVVIGLAIVLIFAIPVGFSVATDLALAKPPDNYTLNKWLVIRHRLALCKAGAVEDEAYKLWQTCDINCQPLHEDKAALRRLGTTREELLQFYVQSLVNIGMPGIRLCRSGTVGEPEIKDISTAMIGLDGLGAGDPDKILGLKKGEWHTWQIQYYTKDAAEWAKQSKDGYYENLYMLTSYLDDGLISPDNDFVTRDDLRLWWRKYANRDHLDRVAIPISYR